ncbi:MAG: tetratricopeptide repeat protein [Phycisphaerales bacterium]|nr:tetratricopeptide repeat protein [Phycisphaerales bacterium]
MADAPETTPTPEPAPASWRDAWQLPVFAISGIALAAGLAAVMMARPATDVMPRVEEATKLVEQEKFEDAIKLLNTEVWPQIEKGKLPASGQKQYHLLIARSIYEATMAKKLTSEENFDNVIKSYLQAEEMKQRLDAQDIDRFARCLITLDRLEEAQNRIDSLPSGERTRRIALVRSLVTRILARPEPDQERATALVAWMLSEPSLPDPDRVWAIARQAELRVLGGFLDEAIRGMLQQLPRLDEGHNEERAELLGLLGRAYLVQGHPEEAEKWLNRALAAANGSEPLTSRSRLLLANISAARNDFETAKGLYQTILETPGTKSLRRASLMGLGEVLASLDETEPSLEAYSRLAQAFNDPTTDSTLTKGAAAESMLARFRTRYDAGDANTALRYASLAESLYPENKRPAEVLRALGDSHRTLAEEAIAEFSNGSAKVSIMDLDPTTRKRAREHFISAAKAFKAHTASVASQNSAAFGDSLWLAADAFDRAGEQDQAVALFKQYAEEFPADPRSAEAKFRLARCYQARGDLDLAVQTFEEIINSREGVPGRVGTGPFADASYVPLAQSLIATEDPQKLQRAEDLLLSVLNGSVSGVDSPNFRSALAEFGTMCYRNGNYDRAIERIEEMLAREPNTPSAELLRFRLADSYRLSAEELRKADSEGKPLEQRQANERTRRERLAKAAVAFDQTRRALEAKPANKRTVVEETYLRNAYFYLGDCEYHQGNYDDAIRAYTAARDRYPNEPSSLVAMTQIVNANLERGDYKAAATANERARRFYKSLPAEVWNDPDLPMTRENWERWLDSTDRLANAQAMEQQEHE